MALNKKKANDKINEDVIVNKKDRSNIMEFTERPLPDEEAVARFDDRLDQDIKKRDLIPTGDELLEIYEDERGNIVDVKKINIRKRGSWFSAFLRIFFVTALVAVALYGVYTYFIKDRIAKSDLLGINVTYPKEVVSGDDVIYSIEYKNNSQFNLNNIKIELTYPDNFIFSESLPAPDQNKNTWSVVSISKGASATIKIKGKIIGPEASENPLLVKATYFMDNFSTEFNKSMALITKVSGLGFNVSLDTASSALVGEDGVIDITIGDYGSKLPDSFNLVFSLPTNIAITSQSFGVKDRQSGDGDKLNFEELGSNIWRVSGFSRDFGKQTLKITYRVKQKNNDQEKIDLHFETKGDNNQNYTFWQKELLIDVVKSSLNLSLSLNDNKGDQAVNFGDSLNYSIDYKNMGDSSMKDVVIMAVLNSDAIDFSSLVDKNNGLVKDGIITWTSKEVPALKELPAGQEGVINFSFKLNKFTPEDIGKSLQILSYSQFSIGNSQDFKGGSDNKSNVIIVKVNSNLDFSEKIRYFNDDNVPIGFGPLPPKVGEKTGLNVNWVIKNDLHELSGVRVEYALPTGVIYENQAHVSVGQVYFDAATNKIIWDIGRLPITVYSATADISISVTPSEGDRNRIMVLSNGAVLNATDIETQGVITKTGKAQTTKLEDDDIASLSNDGLVK
ncbi:MAG: hypothetical protein WCK37_02695 [Candidatus Falkowbacteria bacterium]